MLESVATALVLGGVAVLGVAAWLICRLISALPAGPSRSEWHRLLALVACFILGYAGYLAFFHGHHEEPLDLIVPVVFFLGAGFVALVARTMLRTAGDLRRMKLLEEENVTDALTGLYNRRDFDRRWKAELARARRFRLPLTLLMVDVDHFKSVNDSYGHAVGDRVLMAVGRLICDGLRASDIAARYGGEEFAVIAPHTGPQAAVGVAERVRQAVERSAHRALGMAAAERMITVSIGIAGCDNAAQGCEGLFERADGALYVAKQAGRNRVVVGWADNAEGSTRAPEPLAAGPV